MKILFTGASSFTGYWFVKTLAQQGHDVVATFSADASAYEGVRAQRIELLQGECEQVFSCRFGSPSFMSIMQEMMQERGGFDVLCHHAADVTNYHSEDFDVGAALQSNTNNLKDVLAHLYAGGGRRMVITGSIFEPGEGQGSEHLRAFSPYGLSKALTAQVAAYYAQQAGMHLGKFVIPNPFGPYEEPRFTAYLIRTWAKGEVAGVRTPDYIRDNIHVDLMARLYARFVTQLPAEPGSSHLSPSGYIESQGAFAERFAREIRTRTGLACALDLNKQEEFPEPRIRVNSDPAVALDPEWSEQSAWDAIAEYYQHLLKDDGQASGA